MIDVRRLDRERLEPAYGLLGQRLLPWPALNAPFEGAWCVLRAGTGSTPHAHHEYEIFIAVSGAAEVVVGDERRPFVAGDVVRLPPGTPHQVVNDGPDDFEYYGVWWDAEMAASFVARHEAGPR
ncbi:cupin [Actinoplanes sp. NBRC 14428]|uniref:Cupin domain-containing protein n=1 Tax=Pseudosporangium ferrugineum TaxID=439699 RepID=A0A2T0RS16_9ACTN|nr:cupin domain-containing protein [Pseudosporangium ferrugineum]PRY23883.1 Cupin domain-containing protein [Pseudosporangium ferrugineum]BCJ51445.1 cupin [Actinoplanes sp. NBRC 14428]